MLNREGAKDAKVFRLFCGGPPQGRTAASRGSYEVSSLKALMVWVAAASASGTGKISAER